MTSTARVMLGALAGRFLLRMGRVTRLERQGRFVRLDLEGDSLANADFRPGDKVQAFMPDGGMRTYTPLAWAGRTTSLLVFQHGNGPGSSWAKALAVDDEVGFFGPRRSIDVAAVNQPLVVFGDETSVAVSLALGRSRPGLRAVLEVDDPDEVRAVLDPSIDARLVGRAAGRAHLSQVTTALASALRGGAFVVFTGRAASIQAVNRGLSSERFESKTKAYWAEGRRGLD